MKRFSFLITLFLTLCLLVVSALAYQNYKTKTYLSTCLKEGEAAESASLGPSGHFGRCCPGLEPRVKPGEENWLGNTAYCTREK